LRQRDNGRPPGRSDALAQAAKTTLFAAANEADARKSAAGDFCQIKKAAAFQGRGQVSGDRV
jgi:hypothetical protein